MPTNIGSRFYSVNFFLNGRKKKFDAVYLSLNVYNLVSSYNPITNESYDGFDSQDQQQTSLAKRRGLNVNQASNYNVITNQTYDERMAEPSPLKPGRRTVSNNNSSEEGVHFVFCLFVCFSTAVFYSV